MAESHVLNNLELTCIIFQCLKEVTLKEQGIVVKFNKKPVAPKKWATQFAQLATVNRAFFQASIDVLWERMDSVLPFFGYLLPAERNGRGQPRVPLSYQGSTLNASEWDRFKLYSSRTKAIEFMPRKTPEISAAWLSCVLSSRDRPNVLFPSLKSIFVSSIDACSTYIAGNSSTTLEYMAISLHGRAPWSPRMDDLLDGAKALTFGLSGNAPRLTHIKLVSPVHQGVIANISRILSLESLHVVVGQNIESLDLAQLSALPSLQYLRVEQHNDPAHPRAALAAQFPKSVDIQAAISADSNLETLKTLKVTGNGTTQFLVATSLHPKNLNKLSMGVCGDGPNIQLVLIPLVLAVYSQRNKALKEIRVDCLNPAQSEPPPTALAPLRSDPQYNRFDILLDGLSKLPLLDHLEIRDIPFLSVDMSQRILSVFRGHPRLRHLILEPITFTDLEADEIDLPPLSILEDLCLQNPGLTWLETPVNLDDPIPTFPISFSSRHTLKKLKLDYDLEVEFGERTEEYMFDLAQYLERLFPNASVLSPDVADEDEDKFWRFVNRYMSHSRAIRAHALHHSQPSIVVS